jgi:autotransporter translocation and assembly factor TamB
MKPWQVTVVVVILLLIGFLGWLVASYRKGRDGR